MAEILRKAKKEHVCIYCQETIPIGDLYWDVKLKWPRYDSEDNQIGIEYVRNRSCADTDKCIEDMNLRDEGIENE